jgi:hypothetical protein
MSTPERLHKTVLVSGGIWLASFPLMLFYLAVIGMVGQWFDVQFGSSEDATAERVLNVVYMAMVLGTLGVGVVYGLRGWRRHGLRLALAAAILCIVTGVLFVVLPVIA